MHYWYINVTFCCECVSRERLMGDVLRSPVPLSPRPLCWSLWRCWSPLFCMSWWGRALTRGWGHWGGFVGFMEILIIILTGHLLSHFSFVSWIHIWVIRCLKSLILTSWGDINPQGPPHLIFIEPSPPEFMISWLNELDSNWRKTRYPHDCATFWLRWAPLDTIPTL